MPEIAEVALMAQAIRDILEHQQIKYIQVLGGKYLRNGLNNLDQIMDHLPIDVTSVNVKGKFCWIELSNNWYIGITFGMTGGIYYDPTEEVLHDYSVLSGKAISRTEYTKHFRIKFETANGGCFYYGDPRNLGNVTISNDRSSLNKKLDSLGPDMLTGPSIDDSEFVRIFRQPKFNTSNICKVLMGQEAISGVGNYIKAEVLYECKISPWAIVLNLDDPTLINLHHAIKRIALEAFKGHGASLYTYTGTRREKGTFQNMLKVYGKPTDPIGNKVLTISEHDSPDKRTTHYVPSVQVIGVPPPKKKLVIKLKQL
jgi:DNA-formamidopyrimidine glycosylase